MEPRDRALLHARGRIAVGAAFVLFPGLAGRMWIGADAARRPVKVLARAFGVRDLAIGLGVVIALDRGTPVRGWIEAGALSDAVDTCASLLAGGSIPPAIRWPCDGARRRAQPATGACAGAAVRRRDRSRSRARRPRRSLTGHPRPTPSAARDGDRVAVADRLLRVVAPERVELERVHPSAAFRGSSRLRVFSAAAGALEAAELDRALATSRARCAPTASCRS